MGSSAWHTNIRFSSLYVSYQAMNVSQVLKKDDTNRKDKLPIFEQSNLRNELKISVCLQLTMYARVAFLPMMTRLPKGMISKTNGSPKGIKGDGCNQQVP